MAMQATLPAIEESLSMSGFAEDLQHSLNLNRETSNHRKDSPETRPRSLSLTAPSALALPSLPPPPTQSQLEIVMSPTTQSARVMASNTTSPHTNLPPAPTDFQASATQSAGSSSPRSSPRSSSPASTQPSSTPNSDREVLMRQRSTGDIQPGGLARRVSEHGPLQRRRSISSTQPGSWIDKTRSSPTGSSNSPISSNSTSPIASLSTFAAPDPDWTTSLKKRSSMSMKQGTVRMHKRTSSYSGKTATLALRGTVLDLSSDPFADFPELRFHEFPRCNMELSKEQQKVYAKLRENLLKDRERLMEQRRELLEEQKKRDERLMKEIQAEINSRAAARLKEFQHKQKQSIREREQAKEYVPPDEVKREAQTFEQSLASSLEEEQAEMEQRLLMNRIKWIMPWFQNMKASEILHYTRLHQLELTMLEETQLEERKKMEETQETIQKLDTKGFEKQLKDMMKERKHQNRPMTEEEIEWEREVFAQSQAERFAELSRRLQADHRRMREQLESQQLKQLRELETHYDKIERMLRGEHTSTTRARARGFKGSV